MIDNKGRTISVSIEEYCHGVAFRLGLQHGAQGAPWREWADTNDAWAYERARHFLAWWRTLGKPKAPAYEGKKLAEWVWRGFADAWRARVVV